MHASVLLPSHAARPVQLTTLGWRSAAMTLDSLCSACRAGELTQLPAAEVPLVSASTLTATGVSFRVARYTEPQLPSPSRRSRLMAEKSTSHLSRSPAAEGALAIPLLLRLLATRGSAVAGESSTAASDAALPADDASLPAWPLSCCPLLWKALSWG